jgi:A/G-specific adenine glycosylase
VGGLSPDDPFSRAVLEWGAGSLRDLPWRAGREPWPVLVSEVMLQQTPVARVLSPWRAFMAAFPAPVDLARAPLSAALVLWQGLGYPRRCRNLHDTAGLLVERHGGEVPGDLGALLALPGVGPYTARAVLAFSFGVDVAAVDTNISRVLSRTAGEAMGTRALAERAATVLPAGRAWEWNQSMMDLGARICTARAPRCGECPVEPQCRWRGGPGPDPASRSAGASRPQARFEGSDRQLRGRALAALADGSLGGGELVRAMKEDEPDRCRRLIDALVAERLVVAEGDLHRLP